MPLVGADRTGAESGATKRHQHRYTVAEAARILDTTAEAVRSRIKRGTLESIKDGAHVFVLLDADQTPPEHQPNSDQTAARSQSDTTALISAKDETIATLREQLESERQAHAEARRLLLEALQKIPSAIEAPRETPGAPETATEPVHREDPFTSEERRQEPSERPGFWARLFGG